MMTLLHKKKHIFDSIDIFIRRSSSWLLFFSGLFIIPQVIFFSVMPITHWVEYDKHIPFEPVKDNFDIGEPVEFISHASLYRPANLSWNDVLYCTDENSKTFFSNYPSSKKYGDLIQYPYRFDDDNDKTWTYSAPVPTYPVTCYSDSSITLHGILGLTKEAFATSTTFTIGK